MLLLVKSLGCPARGHRANSWRSPSTNRVVCGKLQIIFQSSCNICKLVLQLSTKYDSLWEDDMGLAGKIVAESLRVVGKGTWNLLNSHPAKMLIGGAALFMAVEIGSNGSGIVNGISNWTHGFATHAPQQSPQGFETKLEQNTTSGMHGDIFWQAEFSQGII